MRETRRVDLVPVRQAGPDELASDSGVPGDVRLVCRKGRTIGAAHQTESDMSLPSRDLRA